MQIMKRAAFALSLTTAFTLSAKDYTLDFSGATALSPEAPVIRRAEMAVDVGTVPSVAVGDRLDLVLFGDVSFALKIVAAPPAGIAGQSFIARDENGSASAIVKVSKSSARISVDDFMNRRQYTVRCKDGKATIIERDNSQDDGGECGTCGGEIDAPLPVPSEDTATASSPARSRLFSSGTAFPVAEQKGIVDILVVFDKGARPWAVYYWDEDDLEGFAGWAIDKMNTVLEKSQLLDKFCYRLAGVAEVDATFNAVNNEVLNALRSRSGVFAKISALRDKYGADTITLLINRTGGTTNGIGYEYLPQSWSYEQFDATGYPCNVCDIHKVVGRYTMSHETGHNMGCGHSNLYKETGAHSWDYSYGYNYTGVVNNVSVKFHTIMAYDYTNVGPRIDGYEHIPYFSSPDIVEDTYGCVVGTSTNNNRQTLLNTYRNVGAWREHVKPYDWDVRVLENGREIINGNYCDVPPNDVYYHTFTLTHENPDAIIYYTLDGSEPNNGSPSVANGSTIQVDLYDEKTLKVCAVVDGVAQSVRTLALKEGNEWSGTENGNGILTANDTSVLSWCRGTKPFDKYATLAFLDNSDNTTPVVTVMGEVAPFATVFSADKTDYTFNKGDDTALLKFRDSTFAPDGDVTFNLPVQLDATALTAMPCRALTFNAPFGQTADTTSGNCTNMISISSAATLTVAPGDGKTQTFGRFNTSANSTATFRAGKGNIVFNGPYDSGKGVFGYAQVIIGEGANVTFNCAAATGFIQDMTSPFTIEKGATVTFNGDMEHMQRPLYLNGGTINANSRFDRMRGALFAVNDDSLIDGTGHMQIRFEDEPIDVADGKTLTLNIPTQDGSNTSGYGIIKRGGGTIVANAELKHSGVTDIEAGTLEVGYSSGSTVYGQGWIVASNSTLRVKSGCVLKVPSLTLYPTATVSVSASESAPIVANAAVSLSEVTFELNDADNLTVGAEYPMISTKASFSGVKSIKTKLPKLANDLKWKIEVEDNVLYAKVVEKSDLEKAVAFCSNIDSLTLSAPDDATVNEAGGATIGAKPYVVDGFDTKAVSIAVKFIVPETSPSDYATICSWKLGTDRINCMRSKDGDILCYHNDTQTTANATNTVQLAAGEHLLQIGYYSESTAKGGTRALLDGKVVYEATGLKFSGANVSRIAFGATAGDNPLYPYTGLIVKEAAVLDVKSSLPPPRMTAGGGEVSYSLNVPDTRPRVFPLTPAGAVAMDESIVEASFEETPSSASVSIVASFPADSVGAICGMWVQLNDSAKCAYQAEYDGDGKFYIRYNDASLESSPATRLAETTADVTKPHIYTLTFKSGDGVTLYQDGIALLKASSPYTNYSASRVVSPVTFGCGPYHAWRNSTWHDYPNPAKDFSLYASHIELGTDNRTVSEASVKESMGYDPEESDPEPPASPATVDVLVAYDLGAQAYVANKGVTLEKFAQTQIGKMNDVLVTNKLDRFYTYHLAGVCKVDGTYNNINTAPALIAAGEGPAVSLRAAREMYGADTVTLLVDVDGNTLGNSSPLNSTNNVASQHECAFSVCKISAVDTGKQHTMIHENAHNMGCGHARAQGVINSPFEYGRGYYFDDNGTTRHTIMAYGGDNDASWYFSTTSTEFGFTLGDKTNNNARVLKETCAYVAQWREDGALDLDGTFATGAATWQTGRKYPWTVEGDTIRSYNQTYYTYQSTMPLKAKITGPKRLSFQHKSYFGGASVAGNNYSHFDVLLDDSPVLTQTECTNTWTQAYVDIPDGSHEVTFVFSQRFAMNNPKDNKDGNAEAIDDAVWLKGITIGAIPSGSTYEVPEGVTVNLSGIPVGITQVTGKGTVLCGSTIPGDLGWTNEAWQGTVAFSGLSGASYNNFNFAPYGNANSKIQLTNCSIPYLINNNSAVFAGTLVLTGDGTAFSTSNGWSAYYNVFGALEGTGAMAFTGSPQQAYVFNTASNYTGSITIEVAADNGAGGAMRGRRVVIGEVSSHDDLPPRDTQSATVTVRPGAVAAIGANATWNAYHGVEIAGTLLVKGSGATLDCDESASMGLVLDNGATLRFDAQNAKLTFAKAPQFASGTVNIAFGNGVNAYAGRVVAWPNGSTVGGKFRLVGEATNNYEIVTDATGASVAAKPTDRLDLSGYSYLTPDKIADWLDTYNFEMYRDFTGGTWQEFMAELSENRYTNLENFILGYSPEDKKAEFKVEIELKDGKVSVKTNEGAIPTGYGIVKRLYRKAKLTDPWPEPGEVMTDKTENLGDASASGFYKVEVSIEAD